MDENKSLLTVFLINTCVAFTASIIVTSIMSRIVGDFAMEMSALFRLGGAGLATESILQIAALSAVFSVIQTLFASDIFFKKVRLLWRMAWIIALSYVSCIVFVLLFRWIPANMPQAWASFIAAFTVCFGIGIAVMALMLKHKDKKYEKLLHEYKEKRRDGYDSNEQCSKKVRQAKSASRCKFNR